MKATLAFPSRASLGYVLSVPIVNNILTEDGGWATRRIGSAQI